jgi:hypothetical protein
MTIKIARLTFQQTVAGATVTRSGTVWSDGPQASTFWVLPDDDRRHPVLVKVPNATERAKGKVPVVIEVDDKAAKERTERSVQAVSRAGQVFGTVNPFEPTLDDRMPVTYHADRACPDAGWPQIPARVHGRDDVLPSYLVTDVLLGRAKRDLTLCRRCIHLEVPTS